MGMAAIFLNDVELFELIQQKAQGENWWKLVKLFQRRRPLKITRFFKHVYNQGARADNSGDKSLIVTKRVWYFDCIL